MGSTYLCLLVQEYDSLIEKVVQMKKEVENECSEMFQYKQDLQVSAGNRRHDQSTDGALLETSMQVHIHDKSFHCNTGRIKYHTQINLSSFYSTGTFYPVAWQ